MRWMSHQERMRTQMRGWARTWASLRSDRGPLAPTIRRLCLGLAVRFRTLSNNTQPPPA